MKAVHEGTERARGDQSQWEGAWQLVPDPWRTGTYRLDAEPANRVFVRNSVYLRSSKDYDFRPKASKRMGQELAWWVWTIWSEGARKVDPAMLRWWQRAVDSLARQQRRFNRTDSSIADFGPDVVVREALKEFHKRHGRYPSPGNVQNLESVAVSIHQYVSIRCSDAPWWTHDTWSLTLDNRIPRRVNEPFADRPILLGSITPLWIRDGLRFWLSLSLIHDTYTWSTANSRAMSVGHTFATFCRERDVTDPVIEHDLAGLRRFSTDFRSWLASPEASKKGRPLARTGADAIESAVQRFYEYMADNSEEAAEFTGDPRWLALSANHARLWAPRSRKRKGNKRELAHIAANDVTRMFTYLDILTAPTDTVILAGPENGPHIRAHGLGDPQTARAWALQAFTGRRASEILMLDHNPITRLPDIPDDADETTFVARLRYQQTKVDDVDPTILVDRAVVTIIEQQQKWLAQAYPDVSDPKYLFVNPRANWRALRPRSYRSYQDSLKRLDALVNLRDADDRTLRFTTTHRLRHTRATELLNGGVPVHVVQRYLGHRSPEMTMRYAATLASTAEAEFLKYKKIGADGRDVNLTPRDILDIAQLDQRADRILPNGLCLLPPTQTCDRGNACLPCGSFATDSSHLPDHHAQRDRTTQLIESRTNQYQQRFGQAMPDSNVWLTGRRRELESLDKIITRLESDDTNAPGISGAGSGGGTVNLTLVTDPTTRAEISAKLHEERE